ncbi:138_t:CDS:2 [Entrophospora sp. SA101]|nr:138_t:CDS:2 [Entrophospora sp. SA101]
MFRNDLIFLEMQSAVTLTAKMDNNNHSKYVEQEECKNGTTKQKPHDGDQNSRQPRRSGCPG